MTRNNKNDHRIEFKLTDFFVDKLKFENNTLYFGSDTKISEVAKLLGISIKKALKDSGLDESQDADHILDDEQIAELCLNNNIEFEKVQDISPVNVVDNILNIMKKQVWTEEAKIKVRPPVITIMGHVDHGKTTLLDAIRKSILTKNEVGGITQTIGAYRIKVKGKNLTFIDTPGHEAFTEMRASGSKVTDIVIIVVAADDSIMPQTKESIDHAKAAKVPIIVAVNKMDTIGADFEKVRNDLAQLDVIDEEWGGDVPFVQISALKQEGIDNLIDTIILTAELLQLKSPENILASGTVIESNIHKTRGNLVSVIVQNGTLKIGDNIIIDDFVTRIKSMYDEFWNVIKIATPGTPIVIFGIGKTPLTGSKFVVSKEKDLQKIADAIHFSRLNSLRKRNIKSAADLFEQLDNSKKSFNIILKADALGVLEAINSKIKEMSTEDIKVEVIRKDVGDISTTDVTLAEASKGHIYTFNIKTSQQIKTLTKNKGVKVFEFDIIYKMFEDIENKLSGLTEDKYKEVKIGYAEILQLFSFSKVGIIAGSQVKEGLIKRDSLIDIERNGKIIASTKVKSLQFQKDQLKEAKVGRECGIVLEDKNILLKKGDLLIAKELVKLN